MLDNSPGGGSQINGMVIRGSTLTTESIWDDTDVVHVLRNEISSTTSTPSGACAPEQPDASLVIKLQGAAGFTANGEPLDIEDRIGGTLHILGTPDYPVVLTSLYDDTAAAGFNLNGKPQGNTDPASTAPARQLRGASSSTATPTRGTWRSSTRSSRPTPAAIGDQRPAANAQFLGYLAPDVASDDEDDEGGDETSGSASEITATSASTIRPTRTSTASSARGHEGLDRHRPDQLRADAKVELVRLDGTVIASSTDNSTFVGAAGTLTQQAFLGGDFYTTNQRDPGMYVVLPGAVGAEGTYFVRVTSQNGTSGYYQLQLRLRQVDEKPGSTIRYADIRYATSGIEVYGQPAHSILAAEAGETTANNNTQAGAQNLGNLLESDLNTIGVSGDIPVSSDVDWYRFEIDLEQIQTISGVNTGGKTWSTVFDIDYADGISRADTVLAVYDSAGRLVLVGRDSNIEDDQPGTEPGAGLDRDDLSRGSFDTRDPFIGPVHMPATDQVYYVAVSSNRRLPTELNQTFQSAAANPDIRLEPIDSVQRIVEDHIGFSGFSTGDNTLPFLTRKDIKPIESDGILHINNATALSAHVVPYALSDVVLFVSTDESAGDRLRTVNPFTGQAVTNIGGLNGLDGYGDLAMRPDGVLFGQTRGNNNANSGNLRIIDTATAAQTNLGDDAIPTNPDIGQRFEALAFMRTSTGNFELYAANNRAYDLDNAAGNEGVPAIWRISATSGAATDEDTSSAATGLQPVGPLPAGATITGMAFSGNVLYAVDSVGTLWRTSIGGSSTSRSLSGWASVAAIGAGLTGLSFGPQNVNGGAYANMLFASGSDRRLYAFSTSGARRLCSTRTTTAWPIARPATRPPTRSPAWPSLRWTSISGTRPRDGGMTRGTASTRLSTTAATQTSIKTFRTSPTTTSTTAGQASTSGWSSGESNPNNDEYLRYGGLNAVRHPYEPVPRGADEQRGDRQQLQSARRSYGGLVTNTFSLTGSVYADKPTVYVSFISLPRRATHGPRATRCSTALRIWVWGSYGGTLGWHLLATNDSTVSTKATPEAACTGFRGFPVVERRPTPLRTSGSESRSCSTPASGGKCGWTSEISPVRAI